MNKQSFITILLTVLMSMIGVKTFAHDIELANDDGVTIYYNWTNNHTELAVCCRDGECSSYSGNVVIPATVVYQGSTYKVTSIEGEAFYECSGLTSVRIPNSIKSIGCSAFYNCRGLTITMPVPNSLTDIFYDAFEWCPIQVILLIKDINDLYNNNYNSAILRRGSNNILIDNDGKEIKEINYPNNVTALSDNALYGCSGLTSITIPNSVTTIGSGAFAYCSGLTSLNIPNKVTSIGNETFCGCSGLTSLTIPNKVSTIGYRAFCGCNNITSINIPNSVTSIGDEAFCCSGLTSVIIPKNVISIDFNAFSQCSNLISIISEIENPLINIRSNSFSSIPSDAWLIVPKGTKAKYQTAQGWKEIHNIGENIDGDVNLDGKVNKIDVDALETYIMGEFPDGLNEYMANVNKDDKINAADIVKLIDVRNTGDLGIESQLFFDNIDGAQVISSLNCTLTNNRYENIQLTRCELRCNGNLVSYKNFSGSSSIMVPGGSKSCSFDNLSRLATSKGFTICWHYTSNNENFVYSCSLTE